MTARWHLVSTWLRGHPLLSLFLLAAVMRLGAAMVLWAVRGSEIFHPDSAFYLSAAEQMVASWREGTGGLPPYPRFAVVVAVPELLTGRGYGVGVVLTGLVGALGAPLAFTIVSRFASAKAAGIAGCLLALDPAQVYFATQLLRDAWFTTAALAMVWALADRTRWWAFLAGWALFAAFDRPSEGLVLAAALPPGIWIMKRAFVWSAKMRVSIILMGIILVLVSCFAFGLADRVAQERFEGDSDSHVRFYPESMPDLPLQNCAGLLLSIVIAPFLAMLFPLPLGAMTSSEIAFGFATVWTWAVLLVAAVGSPTAYRQSGIRQLWALTLPAAAVLLMLLGLVVSDAGPLVRWRLQAMALVLLACAPALVPVLDKARGRFAGPVRRSQG